MTDITKIIDTLITQKINKRKGLEKIKDLFDKKIF